MAIFASFQRTSLFMDVVIHLVIFNLPEEQPGGDEGLIGASGLLVHDVKVRGVEGEGSGGQTVSHQVDPQKLQYYRKC